MSLLTHSMVNIIEKLPEGLIWKFARRYIAGADIQSGLDVREELYREGMLNTMDVLGENTESNLDADKAMEEYLSLIRGMSRYDIPGNISLKLTQLGLLLDFEKTYERVLRVAEAAWQQGFLFRLDMEDATTTDQTIEIYFRLKERDPRTGIVLQAYLKRTLDDVIKIVDFGDANIRICKGIYKESASIAYYDKQVIRDNFMASLRVMFDKGSYPAIATHDPFLIRGAMSEICGRGISSDSYEFQMLHGVGFNLRKQLLKEGHPLRIYIPFGASWKDYSIRRFRENPTLAFYVIKNLVLRG